MKSELGCRKTTWRGTCSDLAERDTNWDETMEMVQHRINHGNGQPEVFLNAVLRNSHLFSKLCD